MIQFPVGAFFFVAIIQVAPHIIGRIMIVFLSLFKDLNKFIHVFCVYECCICINTCKPEASDPL